MKRNVRLWWLIPALALLLVPQADADEFLWYTDLGIPAASDIFLMSSSLIWLHSS